jgi:NUBPL iron-transfer P-loop NTPase
MRTRDRAPFGADGPLISGNLDQQSKSILDHTTRCWPYNSHQQAFQTQDLCQRMRQSIVLYVCKWPFFVVGTHACLKQGTESELAGKSAACEGCPNQDVCASGTAKGPDPALPFVRERMTQVNHKILVLSGKGGVGKSTFAAQLGWAFASDPDVQVRPLS